MFKVEKTRIEARLFHRFVIMFFPLLWVRILLKENAESKFFIANENLEDTEKINIK